MKVGFTYDLKSDWPSGLNDPVDVNAELDSDKTVKEITAALESGGHEVVHIGNVKKLLARLSKLNVDIVFNICEGYFGRNRESQVPVILEMNGIPFVGSDALTLGVTLDKVIAKKCFIADGIPTPRYFSATCEEDCRQAEKIGFPLIVKARYEGTSKGLTTSSRVSTMAELKRQVAIINTTYGQSALVEEFISGYEFTVPVIGNKDAKAMPVAQVCIDNSVNLGEKFYSYELVKATNLRYICPPQADLKLVKNLQDIAVKAFHSVDCRDVGRVDFRVDAEGHPYVLEINPLPNLGREDVFDIFPKVIGTTYEKVVNQILEIACRRNGLQVKAADVVRAY